MSIEGDCCWSAASLRIDGLVMKTTTAPMIRIVSHRLTQSAHRMLIWRGLAWDRSRMMVSEKAKGVSSTIKSTPPKIG